MASEATFAHVREIVQLMSFEQLQTLHADIEERGHRLLEDDVGIRETSPLSDVGHDVMRHARNTPNRSRSPSVAAINQEETLVMQTHL